MELDQARPQLQAVFELNQVSGIVTRVMRRSRRDELATGISASSMLILARNESRAGKRRYQTAVDQHTGPVLLV